MLFALLSRLFARRAVALATALATTAVLFAQTPTALDGFDPDVDGNVFALAAQADGSVIVGGQFSHIDGISRNNIARLNPDGSVDPSFNPNADAPVRAILVQPDGRIVIGGDFASLQPNATGAAIARGRIARLSANGTVEASFAPHLAGEPLPGGGTLRAQVFALALQTDGSIVVGGNFASVQPGNLTVIFNRRNLLRLTGAGAIDLNFDPNPNGMVLALATHADNKLLIGGGFTSLSPAGAAAPSTRNRVARLNPNGTVDPDFNPGANNGVTAIAVQRDGRILLGGYFTAFQPADEESPASRSHFARLNANGTLDADFFPRVEGNVAAIAVQPDGGLLVGGDFNAVWGRGGTSVARSFVARFHRDGSVDSGFNPILNGAVSAFAFQPDGKIVLGGLFTRATPQGGTTAVVRNRLARLNSDGSLDASFELDPGGRILVSITQSDGRIVIGGSFTNVGGASHNFLARLNADGSVDPTYTPDLNGRVYTMAYEPAGNRVIIGGDFTSINGETRNRIARLTASGAVDPDFNPNINGRVGAIVLQPDGRILVGGTFTNVQPTGAAAPTNRSNMLRLNANGTLDTTFDPSPNSSVAAIAVQSDGKVLLGGNFSALSPGFAANTSAAITGRNSLARVNADGTLDTAFNANVNGQVSAIVVQSDGKVVIGGAFTGLFATGATEAITRNRIARLNADGTADTAYDPNANGNVLAMALQADGRLLIGGAFTTLQPNERPDWILRKYAARLNTDGTVDEAFNLDISEQPGNRVDSLRVQPDGRVLIGGNFTSLQPAGTSVRIPRRNFARLLANGTVDPAFDPGVAGSTGAMVHALAVQPDGKVVAVGNFTDLGGARSTDIARFRPEGTADPEFSGSLTTDGRVNAVVVRPNAAPVPSQLSGFAWLNRDGSLRSSFAPGTRLSGQVNAIAVDAFGRVLLGGSFANLSGTTDGNLVRFNANGSLDTSFNPNPNGQIAAIAIQPDGRIIVVGSFSSVGGVVRNNIARIDEDGSVDVTFDPNANGRINAVVIQSDGRIVVGGAFTSFLPNLTETAVARNYLARINVDGNIDTNYNPSPNFTVNALALHEEGKVIAGGGFTFVTPAGAVEPTTRNGIARFDTDGSLDQNFDPNPNGEVAALLTLPNNQVLIGGAFTTLQPNQAGPVFTRRNLARLHAGGFVDEGFNPNPNGPVTTLALQSDGSVLVGGAFTGLQPNETGPAITRNHLARLNANGSLDVDFNPDVSGTIFRVASRPDGSVLVGGNFSSLQLIGSLVVGGSFGNIGGVPARNLAMLNENGSVNTTFQPRPDGAVNALLAFPDGRVIVGGEFTNIGGAARSRIARFNADGTLDAAFAAGATGAVRALALQNDGKILVGGAFTGGTGLLRLNANGSVDSTFAPEATPPVTAIAVQADGRILIVTNESVLARLNADGTRDTTFTGLVQEASSFQSLVVQADGGIVVSGSGNIGTAGGPTTRRFLARLAPNGAIDTSFNPAPNAAVTALALQPDGRLVIGGSFTNVGGAARVGIARLSATAPATQMLGVSANRSTVTWTRGGTTGEIASVIFEQSLDRVAWTQLGLGSRVGNTANWQLGGLNLPAAGIFHLRARGIAPSSGGTASGIYSLVREFNFANPVPGINQTTTPATAASPAPTFDPFTGIAPRSAITVVPGEGNVEIFVSGTMPEAAGGSARLANLSTRGRVTAQNPLILGFAIAGSEPRRVLVRAVGPGLAGFGVGDALAATRLQIYDASGAVIAANEGWAGAAALVQTAAATGAFPLSAGSADSAAIVSLAPGTYTMLVVDTRGSGGVALAEIYDAGSGDGSRLVNVSSRGAAGSGGDALISGFVIAGNVSQRVLLRGVGPGLASFGATGVVADPAIALYDGQGRELGSNDNWVSSIAQISSAARGVGAFALDAGSKDAAVLATLPAGAYTTQVSAGSTGTALLEIYEVR